MVYINIENLSIDFPLYGVSDRSLKNCVLKSAVGGIITISRKNSIPKIEALKNICLKVNDGDRIGLVGTNGAGKSTLLRAISGIYKPTKGNIQICGKVTTLLDTNTGMRLDSTGLENIYLRSYMLGIKKEEIDIQLDKIIEFSELGKFIYIPVHRYSAGMYARLAFSISTAYTSDILLIDEGIATGDKEFQIKASERIKSFKENTKILIFTSHSQELLSLYCNKFYKIEKGELVNL